ncbi:MAG TPA: FAD-dependent oxidoreductase [Candidatus Baltobacteraceae bacterium]|jgi:pyruvate/2-oxoglutarate dehydrogenase complex dihydrolipoamide dehydrogenase (E3) component|nr:FAD-dependent oxidoreductase [Candidatus Baltobacteraceae bacterium]
MKNAAASQNHLACEVAIIGGGSAGYAAAQTAARAGLHTVVIEGGDEIGGLCILRGCMPSKALLYAAEVLHLARAGKTWGLRIPRAGFDFPAMMARKKALIREFAKHRRDQLTGGKFSFIRARASFLDSHTVILHHRRLAAPKIVRAKYFVICTGSVASPSPVPGLDEVGFINSDEALSLRKLPRSLIVLGGGPVAVELAQFFCRLDVKVSLIQRGEHVLRDFDTDAAVVLENVLQREGVRLWGDTRLLGAFRRGREKGITFQHGKQKRRVAAEEILLALGREAATKGLDLEKAGVQTDHGRIVTDARMQTTAAHIYAAGDCTRPYQIVHIGIEQGEVAAHNIAHPGQERDMDYRLLTSVVFTDPQVASVGLTEKEALGLDIQYLTASHSFADHGKSIIMEAKDGFVKLLADPESGEILGGGCVGPMGGELIHEIIAAMHGRMKAQELAAMPHYHPTLAEIWTYPALELAERVVGPGTRIGDVPRKA